MTVIRHVVRFVDNFDRAQILTTTPGHNGWTIKDTSAAGAPTYLTITEDGGAMEIKLANDTEVENCCMFFDNILTWDLAKLHYVKFIAKVANIGATTVLTLGVGSARADDEDTVTVSQWFKMEGADSLTNLVLESDDGTNEVNDGASGETLAGVYKELMLDFTNGLTDVRFSIDGDRVGAGTTFDLSDITAGQNVQPIVQLSKGSTAGQPEVVIARVEAQYTVGYGS